MPITTLEKTYQFDPAYGGKIGEKHIQGVLGTLWSEQLKISIGLRILTYPRDWHWQKLAGHRWSIVHGVHLSNVSVLIFIK